MSKKKKKVLSYLCTVNEICVQCSSFSGWENTQKNNKQNQKKKKKSDFYWQGVLLVCFWFVCFGFYINCTVQSWEKGETKNDKIKTFLGYFSLYMLYLLLLVLYLVLWLCLNHWNSVVLHTVVSWKSISLVFSMMAAKFVLFKWILPLFVLIDIILV